MNRHGIPTRLAACAAALLFSVSLAAADGSAAGLTWTVPAKWSPQPARAMRVATYAIPSAVSGGEPGECGVFFFGHGQGGSAEENIARWGQQFEGGAPPVTKAETVAGLRVHRVSATGTYLSPGGPMMQSQGKKPGWRLSGAIVEAPQGLVFFKCVGPNATMAAAAPDIDALVRSLRKGATHSV
jgi:hypothetical protein